MVKYLLSLGMIFFLIGCGNTSSYKYIEPNVQAEKPSVQDLLVTESKHLTSPQYLDESKYESDELEIVKLINLRVQYLWEGNEEKYLKLFIENGPISQKPNYQINELVIEDEITFQEQKEIYQAVCRIKEIHTDQTESSTGYVFRKDKHDDQAVWMIADID